jgi:hypothetical protein
MTPTTIEELLREIPVADAADARERAVAAARSEIAVRRGPAPAPRRPRRRAFQIALATALLGAALLSPPGRAATDWVGDLVGIGDVGGKPTKKHREDQAPGPAIVINNGFAPDGTRYEWVVYHCRHDFRPEGMPGAINGYGVSLEWPGQSPDSGGGSCEDRGGPDEGPAPLFQELGTQIVPSQFKGVAKPDLMVSGATDKRVRGVRIVYVDATGKRHRLRVDFERIDRKLRGKIVANPRLGGTFVAFIPGAWAARDEIESRLDMRALETTGKLKIGPIGRRDRRQSARASKSCGPKQPDPAQLRGLDPRSAKDRRAAERLFAPYRSCMAAHGPVSPVQYVALGRHGQVLGRETEPLMVGGSHRPPPGPPLTKRPVDPKAAGKPIVLAAGRSPDGARYEWYVSHYEDKQGKVYGNCTDLWWPGESAIASGSCGPGLPPDTAFGRRQPERVFAKPYGFLTDRRPATRYLMLSGYARPSVARVGVSYTGRDGKRHQAPVELTRVDAALAKRMAAKGPFGYFVAFVARGGGKHPIQVTAYDASGAVLSRYQHRDPLLP